MVSLATCPVITGRAACPEPPFDSSSPAEQDEFDKLLRSQSYGGRETDTNGGESDNNSLAFSLVFTRKTKKRSRSVQRDPEPGPAESSQRPEETTTSTPAGTQLSGFQSAGPDESKGGSGPTTQPVLTGQVANNIVDLCNQIVTCIQIQHKEIKNRTP